MPMNFGTSCEPSQEGSHTKGRKKRSKERKPLSERMDVFDRIVQLCSIRDRSCKELRERLQKDGYALDILESAIQRALNCGLVDDNRFADAFIRGKVSSGKGLYGISRDLEKHGIDPETIENQLDAYALDEDSQLERALEYLKNHPPKTKDPWAGAYRKLISKGYSVSLAGKACRIWAESL